MARKRTLIGGAVLAGLLAVAALAAFRGHGNPRYRTAQVTRGDVAYTVSATGTPNAVVTVQVGSQVSGNILALYADFNTKVKKDQVVARIDPQIFQARVDQAQATLNAAQAAVISAQAQIEKNRADVAAAEASLANARANSIKAQSGVNDAKSKLNRRQVLVKEGVLAVEDGETAQSTYDQAVALADAAQAGITAAQDSVNSTQAEVRVAETQLSSSRAQVRQAQAALAQAQADLDHTFIRAPVDGVVVARHVDVGQTVAASLQAPTLFEIAEDLTKMQVDTNVSEADVGRLAAGMPATFTVDAYPGQVFRGNVDSIRKAPINVQNVITYDVVIAVANPDLKLFPGMTANVKIRVDDHPDVLRVPNAALRFRPEDAASSHTARKGAAAQQQTVWVLDEENKPQAVPVTLGITDGVYTEIAGTSLHEGQAVIVATLDASKKQASTQTASPFGASSSGAGRGGRGGF